MKKLKTLHEADARARADWSSHSGPELNGIACPECGAELFDSSPGVTYTSAPPMKAIHCTACEYQGFRVV